MYISKPIKGFLLCSAWVFALPTYTPMDVTKYPDTPIYYPMDVTVYPMNVTVYPMDGDRDRDGVPNSRDDFPDNSNEQYDTDHDGIGNNADPDDDNDGIPDAVERANRLKPSQCSRCTG